MVTQQMRPPGFPAMPPMVRPQAPPPPASSAPQEDEPPSKKQKTEDQLVPEEEWLRQHKVCLHRILFLWNTSSCLACPAFIDGKPSPSRFFRISYWVKVWSQHIFSQTIQKFHIAGHLACKCSLSVRSVFLNRTSTILFWLVNFLECWPEWPVL